MKKSLVIWGFLLAICAVPSALAAVECESLASLKLPNTKITRAQTVPAGKYSGKPSGILEPGDPANRPYSLLPAFCRIDATLTPSSDSDIKIQLWMPATGWNGKFEAVGNGGWAGAISVQALALGLGRGYAIASTDTGHEATRENHGDGSFALNHPEKLVDFAYRAVHEMTVQAKAIVTAYYGKGPKLSYWDGCSTGGRQGLEEAQRYPADYDGIIAGAPANYMTHLLIHHVWVAQASLMDPASYIPPAKYPMIHQAVLDACDKLDGVKDGMIQDAPSCHFDPKTIECKAGDAPTCLTAAQVETARKIYGGAKNSRTGEEIYPGLEPGSELQWSGLAEEKNAVIIAADYFKYVVYKNPKWDFKTFNFDKDVTLTDKTDNGLLNAIDPNLQPFFSRGGKLLMYHSWADQLIAPKNSINYYTSVANALGGTAKVNDSIRLFMLPAIAHCGSNFDRLTPLEQWVEQKKAPERIVAGYSTKDAPNRARLLCPYPQVAKYSGTGDSDDAANFACVKPK